MHIVVLGAGAVGGYFGGRLAKAGTPVTFLVRERRYNQLSNRGLNVRSIHGDFTVTPRLALSAGDIEDPDVVIVGLKNYHLEGAWPDLRVLVQKGAVILPLMNGVQHLDQLVREFGEASVFGGVCYIESTLDADGQVVHTSPMHDVVFGSLSAATHPLRDQLEAAFNASGINVRVSPSITVDMWQKFIFLTSFSGITAATRKHIGEIQEDTVTIAFLEDLVQELIALAKRKQVGLPSDAFDQVMNKLRSLPPAMTSSLHRDLEKGLPLEIDSLQGAALDMAAQCDLDTPCIRSVYALLHPFKQGR